MTNTRASELQSYTELQSFESRASELQELQSYRASELRTEVRKYKTP